MEKKANNSDVIVPTNYCQIPTRTQSPNDTDLLITSYHETVHKLRNIRNKLYKLGIDPEKLSS